MIEPQRSNCNETAMPTEKVGPLPVHGATGSRRGRYLAVATLALLSPFLAEIVFGATPVSRVGSLAPLLLLYGGGSVLIRELSRRGGGGWRTVFLLGAAFALIEEGPIMQTMFSPDLFGAGACGGRAWGVNWIWIEALLGYHTIWSIAIPIALTEMAFPQERRTPWLGKAGLAGALASYGLGAVAIAVAFRRFVTPDFRAPAGLLALTGLAAAGLVFWALRLSPRPGGAGLSEGAPSKQSDVGWGVFALGAASLWLRLFALPAAFRVRPRVYGVMALAAACAWSCIGFLGRRSASEGWGDKRWLALATGAVGASILDSFRVIASASRFDRGAHAIACIVMLAVLGLVANRMRSRPLQHSAKPNRSGKSFVH
jgi:hypothetical protein